MDKLCRLMSTDPSQSIEPLRLARIGKRLQGQFRLDVFQRLGPLLNNDLGGMAYRLDFAVDPDGIPCVDGEITASVEVICQRCLEPFKLNLEHTVNLGIVTGSQQARLLPSRYEPLILEEDSILLQELIEDELLLALPFSPVHATEDCPGLDILKNMSQRRKQRPFAELAKLRLQKHT